MKPFARLRTWFTGSIRRQLIIGIGMVHAVMMTIFVYDLVSRQHDFLHQQSLDEAQALAKTLASNSISWVLANDVSGLQEVVWAQDNYPQLRYAMVVDTTGKVLGHTRQERVGLYLTDTPSRRFIDGPPRTTTVADSTLLADVAVPIFAGVQHIGWARIGLDQQALYGELSAVTREGLFYTAAAILIGILFAIAISRGMITGLNDLFVLASRICAGERGRRVDLQRKDEIGDLGLAFNMMLDNIDEEERQKLETQQQLEQAQERIHLLLDSTAEGILGFDADGLCSFANLSAIRALGFAHPDAILHRPIKPLLWGEHHICQSDHAEQVERVFETGEPIHCAETTLLCQDGSRFDAEYWLSPILHGQERIGAVLTFIDISRRKEAEQELAQYRETLEERVEARTAELTALNRELEAFSYSVSHDLRAPLRSIHGFSRIIHSKYHDQLDATGQDYLERVMRASNRMGTLIDDLLVLSRINRREMTHEPIDMAQLAEQVMRELQAEREAPAAELTIAPLPTAYGDRKLLGLVLQNLLENALKFSAREPQPQIRLSGEQLDAKVVYTVSDNGVGFDMEFADKLFGAFQRLHSPDEFEGTGIGLATVQRIIHRHGGEVWGEAEPDKGAQFHFSLPEKLRKEDEQ